MEAIVLSEFFLEYALFAAKALTVVVAIVVIILSISRAGRGRPKQAADGRLEVEDLNRRYTKMADAIHRAILPRKIYKAHAKQQRRSERDGKNKMHRGKRLFVLDFQGDIMASEAPSLKETISALLLVATPNDEVLLRLTNAGGAVPDHGLAASQLLRLRSRDIPLTVAVDKVAASGGYLMASVANRIIAAPFAIIGSIGVLVELPNFNRFLRDKGIDFELHTAGEHKRTLTLFGENTDEGRAKLKDQLEQTHGLFKGFVQRYRPDLDLAKLATGEWWYGEQALELGLIDALSTSDDYILAACETSDILKLSYRARKRPLERLLGSVRTMLSHLPSERC